MKNVLIDNWVLGWWMRIEFLGVGCRNFHLHSCLLPVLTDNITIQTDLILLLTPDSVA